MIYFAMITSSCLWLLLDSIAVTEEFSECVAVTQHDQIIQMRWGSFFLSVGP